MKLVKLLHNPGAGDEAADKDKLETLVTGHGFECRYSSTKKDGWEAIDDEVDILAVAGGDGTIRKAAQMLLGRRLLDKAFPIGVLPLGTANNIAQTLGLTGTDEEMVKAWQHDNTRRIDVGRLWGMADTDFFIESFGYGIFPQLIKEMHKNADDSLKPEEKLQVAAEKYHQLAQEYEARHCELFIDGKDYSGRYLVVEVMNIRSLGPNLELAPGADPGDGLLEVVLVPENNRDELVKYTQQHLSGKGKPFEFYTVKGKEISLIWQTSLCHADDRLIKLAKQAPVNITVLEGVLEFLLM